MPYVCAVCDQPIEGEDPHTNQDGEDVHARCCAECAWQPMEGTCL